MIQNTWRIDHNQIITFISSDIALLNASEGNFIVLFHHPDDSILFNLIMIGA